MKFSGLKKALAVGVCAVSLMGFGGTASAEFQEFPIGDTILDKKNHFECALVYFQPIEMLPAGMMLPPDKADIHIETDIHATEGNDTGFGVGEWIPYLTVHYTFTKRETGEKIEGVFMPMNADDGPHYGANIKMPTADTYSVKLTFHSPEENGFLIHLDDETGPGGALTDYEWPLVLELDDVWDYVPQEW